MILILVSVAVVIETHIEEAGPPAVGPAAPQAVIEGGRYVLRLEGFSDMLESSDETAVDSLEPELVEIASHEISNSELEPEGLMTSEPRTGKLPPLEETYLRRPNFRVDVESDADCDSELLMTSEEADSLLSSR